MQITLRYGLEVVEAEVAEVWAAPQMNGKREITQGKLPAPPSYLLQVPEEKKSLNKFFTKLTIESKMKIICFSLATL